MIYQQSMESYSRSFRLFMSLIPLKDPGRMKKVGRYRCCIMDDSHRNLRSAHISSCVYMQHLHKTRIMLRQLMLPNVLGPKLSTSYKTPSRHVEADTFASQSVFTKSGTIPTPCISLPFGVRYFAFVMAIPLPSPSGPCTF
jgi:hypothetical protein